jgi:hypothetical protein
MQGMAGYRHGHKVGSTAVGARLALVFGCLLGMGEAAAQPVYKWTDERGVVHFSDTAPPKGTEFQLRDLPPPPPVPPTAEPVQGGAGETGPTQGATPSSTPSGPASLEITEQEEEAVGESTHEYRGKVKNVGGTTASDVVVLIRVTDSNQGAECVNEEVEVRPSDLGAGETGTYSAQFSNPCYFGPTTASIRPDWDSDGQD